MDGWVGGAFMQEWILQSKARKECAVGLRKWKWINPVGGGYYCRVDMYLKFFEVLGVFFIGRVDIPTRGGGYTDPGSNRFTVHCP